MCKLRINMGELDAMVRFYIAIFFMVLAVFSNQILFLVLTIILIFTAIKRRCFLYSLLGINKKLTSENYYKNIYMKSTPNILIFLNEDNEVLYSNKIEVNIYLNEISENLKNNNYLLKIDKQIYTICYSSILENQIRLIELKK